MRRVVRRLLVGVLLIAIARSLHAQRLAGVVRDDARAAPVAAAVVSILGDGGAVLARTVTDRAGTFRIEIAAGARTVQVRRIGFLPRDLPIPDSARTTTATITVALQHLPAVLQPMISEATNCPKATAPAQALGLWEQAQLGFLATVVARDASAAQTEVLAYTRRERQERILDQTVEQHEATSSRPMVATHPPEVYAQRGYAAMTPSGPTFLGPDADVLLHESFRATHCFDLAKADKAHPNQVGITITPTGGRESLVEISGTLWLDQSPLALRELEFRYEAGDGQWRRTQAGGHIVFRAADNGIVVVEHWDLRLPEANSVPTYALAQLERGTGGWRYLTTSSDPVMHVSGGELLSANWPDGASIKRTLSTVKGSTLVNGRPTAGVNVVFSNGPYRARSGVDGSFMIHDVLPGPYAVTALDSAWDGATLGRAATGKMDVAASDAPQSITLALAPLPPAVTTHCSAKDGGGGPAAIVGRAVDDAKQGVAATFMVKTAAIGRPGTITFAVTTPSTGDFRLCGLFPGIVYITARGQGGAPVETRVPISRIEVVAIQLPVTRPP